MAKSNMFCVVSCRDRIVELCHLHAYLDENELRGDVLTDMDMRTNKTLAMFAWRCCAKDLTAEQTVGNDAAKMGTCSGFTRDLRNWGENNGFAYTFPASVGLGTRRAPCREIEDKSLEFQKTLTLRPHSFIGLHVLFSFT